MLRLLGRSKPKAQWCAETIRRRGVRAVVAMLRLKNEHEQLRREHHRHIEETVSHMTLLRALRESLRAARKLEGRNGASKEEIRNTWLTSDRPHS